MINNNSLFLNESVFNVIITVLKDWSFWKVIISTFFIIGLGYSFLKFGIFKKEYQKCFITLVMSIGLPALILNGFLTNINKEQIKSEILILLIGMLFYVVMLLISRVFFLMYDKDVQDVMSMAVVFASTTFFGMPLALSIWGQIANPSAQIFNIPYRIFLYSIGFFVMSSKKLSVTVNKKEMKILKTTDPKLYNENRLIKKQENTKILKNIFANPILICTAIGFIIWTTQLIPGIKVVGITNDKGVLEYYSFLRIDAIFPPVKKILETLSSICTPIIFLMIGMKLTEGNLKEIIKDKQVWYLSIIKCIVIPFITLLLTIFVAYIASLIAHKPVLNEYNLGTVILMIASPIASVIISYAITYDRAAVLLSKAFILQILISIITMPIWIIVVKVVARTMTTMFNV